MWLHTNYNYLMNHSKNIEVLLICEGTFPYNTGGVSTWANDLCTRIEDVDFTVYSINANVERSTKYHLGDRIKKVIQVPMWSSEEPFDCLDYGIKYSKILQKRELTTESAIASSFSQSFKTFIEEIYATEKTIEVIDQCFHRMWQFFQKYDYKKTMSSAVVWNSFKEALISVIPKEELEDITLEDTTTAMRWIYRFLIPMAIKVPKVDIAHITISGIAVLPALALKYKYNTPILVTEHGVFIRERLIAISSAEYPYFLKKMLINFSECITKLVYYHATKITTVSKFNLSWETFYGANAAKINVVYNGVDHTRFKPLPKPEPLLNIPTVVAAARIFDLKDIITMIRVCHEVRKSIPNVQFLVYGNKDAVPEYTFACEELIASLNLKEHFHLKGFHHNPSKLYSEGDLSILTSISEGFPYTVIESMSCGIPVVSTDVGGVSEALDETCGFICKPKDYQDIADKVITLLNDPDLRREMGDSARKRVISNFTINSFTTAFKDIYKGLGNKDVKLKETKETSVEIAVPQ